VHFENPSFADDLEIRIFFASHECGDVCKPLRLMMVRHEGLVLFQKQARDRRGWVADDES